MVTLDVRFEAALKGVQMRSSFFQNTVQHHWMTVASHFEAVLIHPMRWTATALS